MKATPPLQWKPTEAVKANSNLTRFMDWLTQNKGIHCKDYDALWQWSCTDYEKFWSFLLEYFNIKSSGAWQSATSQHDMPGVKWFSGLKINYAEHVFEKAASEHPAIIACSESGKTKKVSWNELRDQVAKLQRYFKSIGIKPGDRIAAFLPNIPEASATFLACNSLGAVWSSCSPDFGTQAVLDRFVQIEPKVLVAVDQYQYAGKSFDKIPVIEEVAGKIPSIKKIVVVHTSGKALPSNYTDYQSILSGESTPLTFERVDFNDPMWVLYSSGTTGLPKPITHSVGGMLLEQLKYVHFHQDVHAGERCFWFTTTGWMMWNYLHGCWLGGATIVLYDGSPAWPNLLSLWRLASEQRITHFGTSAGFILSCMKEDIRPSQLSLESMRSIGSTGSTLPPEGFDWIYHHVKPDVWLTSMSGGTDVCSAFVGGNPLWPVYEGEIQCRALGCSLEAWSEDATQVAPDEEGEMVITKPMPCMPVYFWNDKDFKRYRESYFEIYPGFWRHGDWIKITARKGIVIYGRSDATLNRGGVRIGTSEIYRALDLLTEVKDALIVCIEKQGGLFYMPLFVALKSGEVLTTDLKNRINNAIKSQYSPRHVPDDIIEVNDIPYTLSGKKTEMPVKKILMGRDPARVINRDTLRNPESLDFFISFARQH